MISESMHAVLMSRNTQIGKVLYQSSNAVVYEGDFRGFPAAVKVQYLSAAQNTKVVEREIFNLSSLQHENILRIYDYFWHCESQCYCLVLTTELCMKDFDREVKDRKASGWFWAEVELWSFLNTVVVALATMQRQNIAHRDIKPSNLFLAFDGTIKLGDFGSSKLADQYGSKTLAGTPFYLSPLLKAALVNCCTVVEHNEFKSDVYSLGIVLLTMAKLDLPTASVFSMNPSESFMYEISALQYSDRLKDVLKWMLAWEEQQRCDFLQLEEFLLQRPSPQISDTAVQFAAQETFAPVAQDPVPAEPSAQITDTLLKPSICTPDTCEICGKASDLMASRQLFVVQFKGKKCMCCSKECKDIVEMIKQKRKEFECPICHESLPEGISSQIATFLQQHESEFSVNDTCPACKEVFEFEVFAEKSS